METLSAKELSVFVKDFLELLNYFDWEELNKTFPEHLSLKETFCNTEYSYRNVSICNSLDITLYSKPKRVAYFGLSSSTYLSDYSMNFGLAAFEEEFERLEILIENLSSIQYGLLQLLSNKKELLNFVIETQVKELEESTSVDSIELEYDVDKDLKAVFLIFPFYKTYKLYFNDSLVLDSGLIVFGTNELSYANFYNFFDFLIRSYIFTYNLVKRG